MSAPAGTLALVRPALKSGLLAVWRDRGTLQFGIDPRRATALTGMTEIAWLISLLDGSRDQAQVIAAAQQRGLAGDAAKQVLALLAAAGALDDFPAATLRAVPAQLRARLAAELATASLARRDCDGGAAVLARRRAASVRIYGTARLGPSIAEILVAAGVGQVGGAAGRVGVSDADAGGPVGSAHANAGGRAGDSDPCAGARDPSRDARAGARGRDPKDGADGRSPPSLAVLTQRQPPEHVDRLMRGRIPHLAVSATEAIGVVGPLVLPGRSACLRCLDLTRTDYDPAWPLILAQLGGREPDPPACDAALTAAVAALAAAQALAFLDRSPEPQATVNGTLELVLPGWQWRRRTWPPHRACICGSRA
jgi:hypothetical protein